MVKVSPKIKNVVVLIILASLLWSIFSLFFFFHYHIDETGSIIVHAHPYQKGKDQNKGNPNHTHTKNEFILLASIYRILSFFSFALFIIYITPVANWLSKLYSLNFKRNFNEQLITTLTMRGPPPFLRLA